MRNVKSAVVAMAAVAAGSASAGDIGGTIRYAGPAPAAAAIRTTKDQGTCGTSVPDESLEVTNGRLRNVIILLKGGSAAAPQPARIGLDQRKCRYHPHVQATPVGSTIEILNSDPVLHNIHGYLGAATVFNLAMPLQDQKVAKTLTKPGVVRVRCDVHAWMSAYVLVADGPYAVAGEDGSFAIQGLAPGSYVLTAWHEKLGERTEQVTVPEKGDVTADFTFGG